MTTINDHLKRYPNARPSTLVYLARRNETTEKLRQEIEAQKRVNEFRHDVGHVSWFRRMLSMGRR
ncbi:hypothetical protein SAMN02982989_3367 [Xaviernesmea oryzae]|uniref:Uncharacterized protein n=1 Tax=Xaviernesmea oryzae TaxID=464029 RepID=A0A1X7G7Q6_9HYPH|nr:hypothetical protein [Xaviernesmea oryzae]SMF65488.1 hypothetical protein SAMN02982989_3367 [Xaviernesmea oryzae]